MILQKNICINFVSINKEKNNILYQTKKAHLHLYILK